MEVISSAESEGLSSGLVRDMLRSGHQFGGLTLTWYEEEYTEATGFKILILQMENLSDKLEP